MSTQPSIRERSAEALRIARRHPGSKESAIAAAELRRCLVAALPHTSPIAGVDADEVKPLAYVLARREHDLQERHRDMTAPLAPPWQQLTQYTLAEVRRVLHSIGCATTAAALREPPTSAEDAAILGFFGPARAAIILAWIESSSLPALAADERFLLRALILRLARDRSGESLAVALGRRVVATAWHRLDASMRATIEHRTDPSFCEHFEVLEPLTLQDATVLSLLEEAARRDASGL